MGGAPAGDENSNTDHSEEQIGNREKVLGFTLPSQVRKFFLLTAGIYVSTGVIIDLFGMFDLTLHGERYCVSGEFWKDTVTTSFCSILMTKPYGTMPMEMMTISWLWGSIVIERW